MEGAFLRMFSPKVRAVIQQKGRTMTGREKIEAALSQEGTDEIPAVICYEGIFVRDHWEQLTERPWWHQVVPDLERPMACQREVIEKTGQDWFRLPHFYAREERETFAVEERPDGVFRIDLDTGEEGLWPAPQVGGWGGTGSHSVHPERWVDTAEEIDARIPEPPKVDPGMLKADGRGDLAEEMLGEFGGLFPLVHVASPLWQCYHLWGFEGMMIMVATRPDLVERVCQRSLAQSLAAVGEARVLGAAGVWIEECLTDMIAPDAFARLNVPFLTRLVDEIRAQGMHSIYYFCGDPAGKWEHLLAVGADALSLEESKKGFVIDIEEMIERAQGKCAVLGNLDAVGVLQDGTEQELRTEIERQIAAGRRNGNRFIMSIGSPVTPGTPVERVRLYCDLVHELGGG
jgi:hypothetical protein